MCTRFLLLTLVFAATTAYGQSDFDGQSAPPGLSRGPVQMLPADYGHWHHHCSTALEGWLRGWAALIHARGCYLVNWFQASILAEQARWLDQSNDQRLIQFHDWKQDRRASRLAAKRLKNESTRLTRYRAAYELPFDELDRATGRIDWPEALRADRYEEQRERLEVLFHELAGYEGAPASSAIEIERESRRLIREFARSRRDVPTTEYFAAQKFLRGLKYEPLFRSQVF